MFSPFVFPCLSLFSSSGEAKNTVCRLCTLYSSDNQYFGMFPRDQKSIKVVPGPSGPKNDTYLIDNKLIM